MGKVDAIALSTSVFSCAIPAEMRAEGSRFSIKENSCVLNLKSDEVVAATLCFQSFDNIHSLVMVTRNGMIKKSALSDYQNYRSSGLIGMNVDKDDLIVGADLTNGQNELMLITRKGLSIRFHESECRQLSRDTRGVIGINLDEQDVVQALCIVNPNCSLLIAGSNGQGKRSDFSDYRVQHRGGKGIIAIKTDQVAGAIVVEDTDEMMLFTQSGQAVRCPIKDIRKIGRNTQGVRLISLEPNDQLVRLCKVAQEPEEVQS